MDITFEHNLSNDELRKAIAGMAIGSGIEQEVLDTLLKARACDDTPKEPRTRAMLELYAAMQAEFRQAQADIERYVAGGLRKSVPELTPDQIRQLQQLIEDRYGFIAAQLQSVDYHPPVDLLYRWQQMGLVSHTVTPETFMAAISGDMHFIRNAYMMGKFIEAVETGKSFSEVIGLAAHAPLLAPDLHAIQVAEQQTAMYLQDNAKDIATKIGQLAIQKRNEQIRQMAIDFHGRKLKRTVLDREAKEEAGEYIPDRYVENWQQFKSELHQAMADKSRDWDRVAYTELGDAQRQGQAMRLLEDGNVDKLVYKMPMPTACAQCKFLYLMPDGTPRLFKLSEMIGNGNNVGRKPHSVRGGKVAEGGRQDGQETLKAVAGTVHPWCQCQGPFRFTGYEPWANQAHHDHLTARR